MLETFFAIMMAIQFFHSIEELSNKFHEKFPLLKMSFRFFLTFEISFFVFWLLVFFAEQFPFRDYLMAFFIILMFTNGVWHIVWWGITRKYVPGLVTAPFFVITFLIFYFKILF